MRWYINTSNYYLSTTTSKIENNTATWTFDVADVTVDWVTLPLEWYYWVDVDFGDASIREIFRIRSRNWYTLTYDKRISPNGLHTHQIWASVWLRDFSQLLNSLSTNTDNFWEIETTWNLSINVKGGIFYTPSNMNANTGKHVINDTPIVLPNNTTSYIVINKYSWGEEPTYIIEAVEWEELTNEWQYPIAKITTGTTIIDEIVDLRATVIWQGNMRSEVYDPDWISSDVFNMDNMKDGETNKLVHPENLQLWNWYQTTKQDTLVDSWPNANISTINNMSLLQWWNIALDTILTAWWAMENITPSIPEEDEEEEPVYEYQLQTIPLSDNAFIVMNNSWQILVEWQWEDYTYDNVEHTLSFPAWIHPGETYRVWIMYDDAQGENIQFTNFVTQEQYDNLPDGQKNSWNVFMIYE